MGQISEISLFIPIFGTLDPVTEVTSENIVKEVVKVCHILYHIMAHCGKNIH